MSPQHNLNNIQKTARKLEQMRVELNEMFPERDHVIEQILYALATREHILIHGIYGTAKSLLISTAFGAFTEADLFSIAMSKFMTESNIIGIPNPKIMREEGRFHYDIEGGAVPAKFMFADELFDANPPVLRVLLGILNERKFMRGRQQEDAQLHTAAAATNGDPDTEVKNSPDLGAVIDRFLFQSVVDYLKDQDSRLRMYRNYKQRKALSVRFEYNELEEFSNFVNSIDATEDENFLLAFETAIEEFCSKVQRKSRPVSDRRKSKLLDVVAASAALAGRDYVILEDLNALRWGLCMGGDDQEHTVYDKVLTDVIDRAKRKVLRQLHDPNAPKPKSYRRAVENIPYNKFFDIEMAPGEGPFKYEAAAESLISEIVVFSGVNLQTDTKCVCHPNKKAADGKPLMKEISLKVDNFATGVKVVLFRHEDGTIGLVRIREKK